MFSLEKRAFWPSFFVCLGLLFCIAVAASHDYLGLWIGICSLLIAWVVNKNTKLCWSTLDYSICFFVIIIFANLFIVNPSPSPLAYFITTYFLVGFLVFSILQKIELIKIYQAVIIVFCLLSVWAIVQFILGIGQLSHFSYRASSIFANPNIYAAAINLLLLPLVTVYLLNDEYKSKYLYIVSIILFASLISSQSRGGWVAFILGCISLFVLLNKAKININIASCKKLFLGFVVVLALLSVFKLSFNIKNDNQSGEASNIEVLQDNVEYVLPFKVKTSLSHRQELNKVAWKNIKENSLLGVGLLNFIYFNYRDTVDYIYGKTLYVHNDYMQLWLELGTLGIIAYFLILGTMCWQGIKSLKELNKEDQIWTISILCALTTCFIHALLSYVFYTPLLVCFMAGYLAVLSNISTKNKIPENISDNLNYKALRFIKHKVWFYRVIISLFMSTILFGYAAAQISVRAGVSMLKENKIDLASNLFTLARKLSPNVSEYYLVEANVWKNIAINNDDRIAANRADKIYAEAMARNPYDVESRLYRAMLHRDGTLLLDVPVSSETILKWLEYALDWRPHHHKIQAEYLRTLKKYGRMEEARFILAEYLKKYPRSRLLIKVYGEFANTNEQN